MIEVPTAPSTTTNMMSCADEWPTLGSPQPKATTTTAAAPAVADDNNNTNNNSGDDWEMLSPTDSGQMGDDGEEVVLAIPKPLKLTRKTSVSAPDLRELDGEEGEEDYSLLDAQTDVSSSVVMVPSVATSTAATATADSKNPWLSKNKVSFRDAILTPSKYVPPEKKTATTITNTNTARVKNKVKSRYVVTPIKRCAKSTGDLLALAEEDEEILGDTDAQEYYQRKSHGAHGRTNGMKQRPDEAKRKNMIVQKKNLQRQRQGK